MLLSLIWGPLHAQTTTTQGLRTPPSLTHSALAFSTPDDDAQRTAAPSSTGRREAPTTRGWMDSWRMCGAPIDGAATPEDVGREPVR